MSDWRHQAECADPKYDSELFFPIGVTGSAVPQVEEAKAVCDRCEVVETCLQYALDNDEPAGVWGGMAEDERRSLKRRGRRAARMGVPVTRRRYSGKGTPVDASPLRAGLRSVPMSGPELAAVSRLLTPDAPLDVTSFHDIRSGRRASVFPATFERVQAVLDHVTAQQGAVMSS